MKKSVIYNLALFYKTVLETNTVKFSTARAVRDIFKPYLLCAIEIESDINNITNKDQSEINLLLNEEVSDLPQFPKDVVMQLLAEYSVSAGNIDFLESV